MFLTNALWIASLSQFRPPDPGANFLVPDPRNEPLRPQTTLACRRFQSSLAKSSVNAFRCIQKAIGSHDFRTPIRENIMNGSRPTCGNTLLTWEDHISITYYYMIMLHISTNYPQLVSSKRKLPPLHPTTSSTRTILKISSRSSRRDGDIKWCSRCMCAKRMMSFLQRQHKLAWDTMGSCQVFLDSLGYI